MKKNLQILRFDELTAADFTDDIKTAVAEDEGVPASSVYVRWESFELDRFPSKEPGLFGRLMLSAPGFNPKLFIFTALAEDFRIFWRIHSPIAGLQGVPGFGSYANTITNGAGFNE